ncbi:hypothetical protein BH10PSE7_BH10PSE7_14940 [soil metagenome]
MNASSILAAAMITLCSVTLAGANPMIKNSGPDKSLNGQEEWLQHRDFFVPYGTGGLEPSRGYPKPYIPGSAGLSCGEAEGLLKQLGYHGLKPLDCGSAVLRFEGSRIGTSYILHIDPKNGNIVRRDPL